MFISDVEIQQTKTGLLDFYNKSQAFEVRKYFCTLKDLIDYVTDQIAQNVPGKNQVVHIISGYFQGTNNVNDKLLLNFGNKPILYPVDTESLTNIFGLVVEGLGWGNVGVSDPATIYGCFYVTTLILKS